LIAFVLTVVVVVVVVVVVAVVVAAAAVTIYQFAFVLAKDVACFQNT
jgi:hypothetical protein